MALLTKKRIIHFSPHNPNELIVGLNDLAFYRYSPTKGDKEKNWIHLVAKSDLSAMKCLSWSLNPSTPDLLAIGLSTGKIILTKVPGKSDQEDEVQREFLFGNNRPCNTVGFNPVLHNLLFAGVDKAKADLSLLIWDINSFNTKPAPSPSGSQAFSKSKPITTSETRTKMSSDSITSAIWMTSQPNIIMASTPLKNIKQFDIREHSSNQQLQVATKSIQGLCSDPFHEHRFASFSEEGIINIWDMRKLVNGPLETINIEKPITEISWSPLRSNLLASVCKEDDYVSFWEFQDKASVSSDQVTKMNEFGVWKSSQSINTGTPLVAMTWHPLIDNQVIALSKLETFSQLSVPFSVKISWSPLGEIAAIGGDKISIYGIKKKEQQPASSGRQESSRIFLPIVPDFINDPEKSERERLLPDDVSYQIKERAKNGYSLDIEQNRSLMSESRNRSLQEMWNYMHRCHLISQMERSSQQMPIAKLANDPSFIGIYGIICGKENKEPSQTQRIGQLSIPVFKSPQRKAALELCGWGIETQKDLNNALMSFENSQRYERAACLALFHLDIRRAIRSLNVADSEQLKLVSLVLSGYEDQKSNPLWKESVGGLSGQFQHPYLRAMFVFLTSTNLYSVLENEGLALADRIGFACRFLDDRELVLYIKKTTEDYIRKGDIEAILLTGLSKDGVELFEAYVDLTGDVQTPTLALSHVIPKEFKDKRAEKWLEIYRELLDTWQLWNERALFDIARQKLNRDEKPPPQMFVRCSYCNTSISYSTATLAPGTAPRLPMGSGAAMNSQMKPTVCSNQTCRKPLPRCALCLLRLGMPLPTQDQNQESSSDKKTSGIELWFTWCQSCRHGGHLIHMEEWFATHTICPVADCFCNCIQQDIFSQKQLIQPE